ncbi:ROK family transcriptional regulator [Actinopolymorpha pittospori]|uniref:ROK family transcriptional regulator n=1 Tax=Actinopolymorpha pittospori TaxID=648752 RepID=UPI001EE34FBE|nr:ROK family transcriptional regulator [Actinopolymorpha pittospori]
MSAVAVPRVWPRLHDAQRRVLFEVLVHGSQSRVALARRLGLSRTSLTRLARELVDLGLVEEGDVYVSKSRGRPPEMLHVRPHAAHLLGVKLTGNALYAVVSDLTGRVEEQRQLPLRSRDVADVVSLIGQVAAELFAGREVPAAVGVCLAGDVREEDGREFVDRSIFLGWDAVPLAELVSEATGLPAVTSNDVQALTAGHQWFGAGVKVRSMVVFGLGAGIGSGLVAADGLMTGAHGRPGKIGHAHVGGVGAPCQRGHHDCVHSFLTMPAIEVNAGVQPGDYPLVVERARAGEVRALRAFRHSAYALGVVVAQFVNVLDPEKVVITGEGTDMLDFAREEFDRALDDRLEDTSSESVVIDRQPFEFSHYARGAAVGALRSLF